MTAAAPAVVPEAGWTPVEPFPPLAGSDSFVSGPSADERTRVCYFRRDRDRRIVGRAWFGPGAVGPPGYAHGGSVAAVLDEAMGAAAWSAGHRGVAARLVVDFRRMLPIGTDAWLEAWVAGVNGRKVVTRARLLDEDQQSFAEAEGLFIMLPPEQIAKIVERAPVPER
jgi:acyl-coenzyme A thioesterase PaaI-like protein